MENDDKDPKRKPSVYDANFAWRCTYFRSPTREQE